MDRTPTGFPPKVVGLTFFQAFINVCERHIDKKLPKISIDIGPWELYRIGNSVPNRSGNFHMQTMN